MDSSPEPNRIPPPPPPSSQESSSYYNYASNVPPCPQRFASPNNQFVSSSPTQRRPVPSSPDMFTSRTLGMCLNSQERNLVRETNIDLARNSVTSSALAVAGETCSLPHNDPSESRAIIKASSGPSTSIDGVVPLSSPMQVTHVEQQIVPYTGSISAPVHTNEVEELSQRQKASNRHEKCKRCSCKKSNCLKLQVIERHH